MSRIKPDLPGSVILGILFLTSTSAIYAAYGIASFPRQEWLLELLASLIFLIPVFNFLKGGGDFSALVRVIGAALLLHSLWDIAHWPGHALIDTPVDPWIPKACPWIDLILGGLLLVRTDSEEKTQDQRAAQ